jgi:hypothetical protein
VVERAVGLRLALVAGQVNDGRRDVVYLAERQPVRDHRGTDRPRGYGVDADAETGQFERAAVRHAAGARIPAAFDVVLEVDGAEPTPDGDHSDDGSSVPRKCGRTLISDGSVAEGRRTFVADPVPHRDRAI